MSMVDVGYYNYQTESKLALECPERNLYVRDKATLALPASPVDMAVVMPSALKLLSVINNQL